MGKKGKKRRLEIRFSLGAVVALLFCWVGISLLAFYLGVLMGRTEGDRVSLAEFPLVEDGGLNHSPAELTFDNLLSLPDSMPEFPHTVRKGQRTGMTGSEKAQDTSGTPERKVSLPGMVSRKGDAPATPKRKTPGGTKLLQVASFREIKSAGNLVRKLRQEGYPCFPGVSSQGDSQTEYYRVFVGPYDSFDQAAKTMRELEKNNGLQGILIRSRTEKR